MDCRWVAVYLESLGALVVFFACLFAVLGEDSLTGGSVGMSISFSLQVILISSNIGKLVNILSH